MARLGDDESPPEAGFAGREAHTKGRALPRKKGARGGNMVSPALTAGVGFEPTSDLAAANGFQDRPVRPLRHPACSQGSYETGRDQATSKPISSGRVRRCWPPASSAANWVRYVLIAAAFRR
jgi:hypothetical protein